MRLYSSPLPLRTTAAWPGFRNALPIPHRYGATAGALLQYSDDRRTFVWADHPCLSVDAVTIDGREVGGWNWYNDVDSTGRAVCFVEFAEAPDDGVDVRAAGRGKLSPDTGNLITNPGDVLLDILSAIGGKDVTRGMLDQFRRECERADITVAGSLESDTVTLQGAVREVCSSVGARFAPDAAGLAFLDAGSFPALETIDRRFAVAADVTLDDLCNDLTLRYDFDGDDPRQALQMECPASVARYGRRSVVEDARWLVSGRVAEDVATRSLQLRARPAWTVSAQGIKRRLRIGEGVALGHPRLPITGTFRVLSRRTNLDQGESAITFEVPAGPAPSVVLVRQSKRIGAQDFVNSAFQTVGDEREFTITEQDGAPIAQAAVTLNGQYTRQTNGAGRVSFPVSLMPVGSTYVLDILTLDGRPMQFGGTV